MENTVEKQKELMRQINQKANINIVTCGHCGVIILHEIVPLSSDECADIECQECGFKSDPSDFPDLFY